MDEFAETTIFGTRSSVMSFTVQPPFSSGPALATSANTARRQLLSTPRAAGGAFVPRTSSSRSSSSTGPEDSEVAYS